ncbi:hypothetical protein NDU88_010630 [Pleurodeles waltl]|uniref:Uncharacterized protein n=1 Tax=Pleurodeles waltl TaxID=8319 RepID=A0AAV7S3U1_PLEWA|nr:hypothetical protein NDU88_010630 [Pleurodeles waltl]
MSPPPPRLRIFRGHRVWDSSAPVPGIPRPPQQDEERQQGPRGPGDHALLPQFNARRAQARPAPPGNGGGAVSTLPAPPRVPHPPGRSSPRMSKGVK